MWRKSTTISPWKDSPGHPAHSWCTRRTDRLAASPNRIEVCTTSTSVRAASGTADSGTVLVETVEENTHCPFQAPDAPDDHRTGPWWCAVLAERLSSHRRYLSDPEPSNHCDWPGHRFFQHALQQARVWQSYVQTHEESDNTMNGRTIGAIALHASL